jgi:hypothetical protein
MGRVYITGAITGSEEWLQKNTLPDIQKSNPFFAVVCYIQLPENVVSKQAPANVVEGLFNNIRQCCLGCTEWSAKLHSVNSGVIYSRIV